MIQQGTQKGATHPYQAVPGLKLPLRLLTVINQREACAPATTKVCLESERNDAGLVDLVDPGELFGQVGSGDRGSRRVKHINDKLTAGKETVCGEFPGTDCDRSRVILGKAKRVSIIVVGTARIPASRHRKIHPAHSTRSHPQSNTHPCFYAVHELYGTTLTAMVSSGDVLICMGYRPRRAVGQCN